MKILFGMLASLLFISAQPALSGNMTILTENLPPLNYIEDGALVGPSVEIVREIQRRMGSDAPIEVYPWARAYKMALEEENVVLFSTTYTKDRHDILREERIVGSLVVWRREPGTFSVEVVNLLQTFATQSVLAIENARLFREVEEKGRELETASKHKSQFLANMSHELRPP